jgi:DNA gyrase subunit A
MQTKEEDYVERVCVVDSHSYLMLFTDTGRVHQMKAYRVLEAGRTAKGSNLINLIEIEPEEKITAMLSVPNLDEEISEDAYIVMVTKRGVVKRSRLAEFKMQRKGGKIALSLDEGDSLIFAALTHGSSDIMIASRSGYAARFGEEKVTVMGRAARGVRGISLRGDDTVCGACIIERGDDWAAENQLLTVSENGFGKRMSPAEFEAKGRGCMGMIAQKIGDKTGEMCGIAIVREEEDIMLITSEGTIIRTPVAGVPVYGRSASGVIMMRLADGHKLVNFTAMAKEEEDGDAPAGELDEAEEASAEAEE